MKRIAVCLMIALLLLCAGTLAFAESPSTRDSDYFNSYGTTLTKQGSGQINITFSCTSVGTASQLGVSTYSVQKSTDSGWVTVSGPHDGSYAYNTSSFGMAKTFYGVAGEKYRVTCTFNCVKDNTMESKSYTSRTVTAQ